jgi:TRAP-type mannitol/chloroaromatic compound transport system permease large subunit
LEIEFLSLDRSRKVMLSSLGRTVYYQVNLQMAFMPPPFASGIFICRGACDPKLGVTMGDIIRGVLPHVGLIIIGMAIFTCFPQIITWLPGQMIR